MTSNWITVLEIMKFSHVTLRQRFALALQARARGRYMYTTYARYTRVNLLRHTFLVTICVTSQLMKFLVHTESRLQSPDVPSPPPLNVWPARLVYSLVPRPSCSPTNILAIRAIIFQIIACIMFAGEREGLRTRLHERSLIFK